MDFYSELNTSEKRILNQLNKHNQWFIHTESISNLYAGGYINILQRTAKKARCEITTKGIALLATRTTKPASDEWQNEPSAA